MEFWIEIFKNSIIPDSVHGPTFFLKLLFVSYNPSNRYPEEIESIGRYSRPIISTSRADNALRDTRRSGRRRAESR